MSKYAPLGQFLAHRPGDEIPMTFEEVERVLGFRLPNSARNWPAWWSNNPGTHVGVRVWREAGWKTSRVDLGSERVTFVRDNHQPHLARMVASSPLIAGDDVETAGSSAGSMFDALSAGAQRMVEDWAEEGRMGCDKAMVEILNTVAKARQRQLVENLPFARMPAGHDSTAMIREDRDAR